MDRIEAWAHAHPRTATVLAFVFYFLAMGIAGAMDYNA
jgi:hypothetical protein